MGTEIDARALLERLTGGANYSGNGDYEEDGEYGSDGEIEWEEDGEEEDGQIDDIPEELLQHHDDNAQTIAGLQPLMNGRATRGTPRHLFGDVRAESIRFLSLSVRREMDTWPTIVDASLVCVDTLGALRRSWPSYSRDAVDTGESRPARGSNQSVEPWNSFNTFPGPVQAVLRDVLQKVQAKGRNELTLVVLGKAGAGKSSLVNSMLNERALTAGPFTGPSTKVGVSVLGRTVGDPGPSSFRLTILDCPAILEGSDSSSGRLELLRKYVKARAVDAFIYVDRLDWYRVDDTDAQIIHDITQALGKEVWSKTIVGLTHANLNNLPPGYDYESFKQDRAAALRARIRSESGNKSAELPVVLTDSGSRCPKADDGEQILPDKTPWLRTLFEQVAEMALSSPQYKYNEKHVSSANNPNRKWRWAIPFLLAAEIWFFRQVLVPLLEKDGWEGDAHGPFDKEFAKEERKRRLKAKADFRAKREGGKDKALRRDLAAARGRALGYGSGDE